MPTPERRRPPRPRRLRCESCLEVLMLRHAWDTTACSCGALLLSGRPARPTVHWLTRGGGGWSELDDEPDADVETDNDQALPGTDEGPERRLGYYCRPTMAAT